MSNIIQINNLNKSFGSVNAVQNLSFRVKKGELFAFLGINGAGKSTTINIMCGQLSKDSGSVFIDKHDLDKDMDYIKRELGVVFQSSVLDSALSVYDNLESRAALYGITGMEFKKRLEELAKILDFENNAEELILQGLCFISLKSLFLMSRQQGLIHRHADLFGMLYQVFAKMKI